MDRQLIGTFVIVTKNNQVLLGKRLNAYKSGTFGCPGGRLELTESILEGAKRELVEETGVKSPVLKYLGTIREIQGEINFIHFVFQCFKWKGEIRVAEPDKCESWNFYPVNNLPDNIMPSHLAGIKLLNNPSPFYIDIIDKKIGCFGVIK